MPDPYASIAEKDESLQTMLADVLELRATDQRQQEMLDDYLAELDLQENSCVLEVGCGTGAISRAILNLDKVAEVTGIDPSPVFIDYANRLSQDIPGLTFQVGDARNLEFEDGSFDLVVFHTTLCHVPGPEQALDEACRVLRPGGTLVIFDGDYTTVTVATAEYDPLQSAVDIMTRNFVENIWLTRQLPKLISARGLKINSYRSHGYTRVSEPAYFLTLIDRGVDLLVGSGTVGENQADSLRAEASRRVEAGEFFGHISYVSMIAGKPG